MPKMVDRQCSRCGKPFQARAADVKRGWGRFCSKSCKAVKQEERTGQHHAYLERREAYEKWDGVPTFSNAHQFSNEEHDCNKDL
ncbi:hypothetical protein WI37_11040 [Burkholderia ubonensis]|nr:hypothetical protein WI37_11040 [Burkholderia ubonensis]